MAQLRRAARRLLPTLSAAGPRRGPAAYPGRRPWQYGDQQHPTTAASFATATRPSRLVAKGDAANNLKLAQIALLTNKSVKIVVNDRFTIEPQGYCLAQQLTILR